MTNFEIIDAKRNETTAKKTSEWSTKTSDAKNSYPCYHSVFLLNSCNDVLMTIVTNADSWNITFDVQRSRRIKLRDYGW